MEHRLTPPDIIALIPVKSLARAKSRLASELSDHDRLKVTLDMLKIVLSRLNELPELDAWAVVSKDEEALALTRELHGVALKEKDAGLPVVSDSHPSADAAPAAAQSAGLNAALSQGRQWALAAGAQALLILPGDIPLLRVADLSDLLVQSGRQPGVAIAPSNDGGTNCLYLRPPDAIPFRFGPGSAALHEAEAVQRGFPVLRFDRDTLAFDVDTPEDLARYRGGLAGASQRTPIERTSR